ncbi:MAG: N-formylglutamate amidohydrolase [Pseudomonadota bacterium]
MTPTALDGALSETVPLLLDSPHSGCTYPPDFKPILPLKACRRAEDFQVDQVFGDAVRQGLPLYKALFPRIYVDVNRAKSDLTPESVDGVLPFPLAPSAKAKLGKGVIWMDAPPPSYTALYPEPLGADEVARRLDACWVPYRSGLEDLVAAVREKHGVAYYLDCHSMQTVSTAMHEEGAGQTRPHIVLSDRDGATSGLAFRQLMAEALVAEGFEVSINTPYKGADLVQTLGRPAEGVHALQIELRRNLYMDEKALVLNDRFADTRARVGRALQAVAKGLAAAP